MLGSATLTMLVSRISSTTASITPRSSRTERRSRRSGWAGASAPGASPSADADTDGDREPHREPGPPALPAQDRGGVALDALQRDAHGHALHDLGEVPRRVVGREQRV